MLAAQIVWPATLCTVIDSVCGSCLHSLLLNLVQCPAVTTVEGGEPCQGVGTQPMGSFPSPGTMTAVDANVSAGLFAERVSLNAPPDS